MHTTIDHHIIWLCRPSVAHLPSRKSIGTMWWVVPGKALPQGDTAFIIFLTVNKISLKRADFVLI
jgi:hypothetical protein